LQAPWGLALLEIVSMSILYCTVLPGLDIVRHIDTYHYVFSKSFEDVLLLSYLRGLAVLLAYCFGSGERMMR
jgi:hypothetical protein